MEEIKQKVVGLIDKQVKLDKKAIDKMVEVPPSPYMGDYAFPCFALSKELKKNPAEIAKELAETIQPNEIVKEIRSLGPFLNFFLNKQKVAEDIIKKILNKKEKFGRAEGKGTYLIEYPGPNTNKPLHLGHVRNMVLGSSLIKIFDNIGKKVIPINIVNDRGVHICKSMLAYKKWGGDDTPEKSNMKSDFFVGKYYVLYSQKEKENPDLDKEIKEMLVLWEKGDPETIKLWKKMNKWALDGFNETYKTFDVKPDKEYFESDTYKLGREIVIEGLKKGLFEKDENGAVVIDLTKEGYDKKVLLRPNGTTVYMTQDIYLAKLRYEDYKFDKMIYVVATEQNYHFNVLFKILEKLEYPFADKCYHFAYGMVNLTTGKMKSREGNVVDADTIVNEVVDLARKETKERHPEISEKDLEKRAKMIAMAAIRFYLIKFDAIKDFTFDPKESISFEGETGPYVQYAHARICSILRKAGEFKVGNFELLKSKEAGKLIILLGNYKKIVQKAADDYKPHIIARYLIELAQTFNEFYVKCPIVKEEDELKNARLSLISAIKQVIANGLSLLSIDAPDEM
ncbi:arginine--tRNA ligase [Nanoarchaeota archaeon]